jgi:hypothetical protein
MAVLFGCQFKNLNYGLEVARGWQGDHVALFESSGGNRLLLWASSWGSTNAAGRYARAWVRERQVAQRAVVSKNGGNCIEWASPDGRVGIIQRNERRVIALESDSYAALHDTQACLRDVAFTEPVEEASRAALNSPLRRFNPVWSWQKDGDYTVTRSLGGLLSRHDHNSVGSADQLLLGLLGESRRTTSYHKWELGAGLIAGHESEARRGTTKTTWLPWGLLASHCAARLPESPDKTITRTSVIWGLGASASVDGESNRSVRVLPFGLLFRQTTGLEQSSIHVLGTGLSHQQTKNHSGYIKCFRVLGIPIWTTHQAGANN